MSSLFQPDCELARDDDVGCRCRKRLSPNGFYRGIAPDADVVLVVPGRDASRKKITRMGWNGCSNRQKYGIRIVNISAGGDDEQIIFTIRFRK
jgi:hypothetical protein